MTAIFVHSDAMAIGVLSALALAGRRVPADVAVVSCDDMPFAPYLTPSLSSLRVPFGETGRAAVELLLRSIAGEPAPESTVRLPVELIVRDSCGGRGASTSPPHLTSSSASPAHREKQKEDS
jgi:LacI family transcriptional regulator